MARYQITWGLAAKEETLPADFSFRQGKYRRVLEQCVLRFNQMGRAVANPKSIQIVDEGTTDKRLQILLASEENLEIPTRACKGLSRLLAQTAEFQALLAHGKLLIGLEWQQIIPAEKPMEDPDLMGLLTKLIIRGNARDRKILEAIKEELKVAGYWRAEEWNTTKE